MPKTTLLAFIALTLLSLGQAAEIRNPGFEQGRKSFEGVGWWWFSKAENCDYDTEIAHSGKRSIRLTVLPGMKSLNNAHWTGAAYLSGPVFKALPNRIYTLRCWMRTEMTKGVAGVAVLCAKKKMTMAERVPVKFMPVSKSLKDWTELVYTFKTPENLSNLTVYAATENFSGRAWFDDFRLEEGAELPEVPEATSFDRGLVLDRFTLIGGEESLRRQEPVATTEIRLVSAGDRLLVRGVCLEPDMEGVRAELRPRDGAVWEDDSVEVFLDAQRSRSSFYQFIVNCKGSWFDGFSGDKSWSPSEVGVKTERLSDRWVFELSIPYTAIGYGSVEARLPNKQMALAVFRNRRNRVGTLERSSWPLWKVKGFYGNPQRFQPIQVGTSGCGGNYNFLTRGTASQAMRPPLAWQTVHPLYEELMGDEPMHRPGTTVGACSFGRMIGLSNRVTAFCLQHGMRYHYGELARLYRRLRLVVSAGSWPSEGIDPSGKSLHVQMQRKYGLTLSVNPMMQFGGAHYIYSFRPKAPMFKHFAGAWFYPDPRVQATFASHVKTLLTKHCDQIDEIILGHEGRFLYFSPEYDNIRAAYLKEDPESWKRFEDQARQAYGSGRFGFPQSHASAKPLERMVYERFVLTEYNRGILALSRELRKIKPGVRLISELDPDGIKPYLYEQSVGAYDYMSQQMPWGGGASRQNVAFHCKILRDLADTPVRGGPHIEHYFVSLNPEEVNEVLSSVFRVGGEALHLWLNDWFGKSMGDYHGAPERVHEIVNVYERYARMRKLRFPQADTAILYLNASQMARAWALTGGVPGGHEEAFTVLGPAVGSWFRFLSDTQIELKQRRFQEFKVIYDTGSDYVDEPVYQQLVAYVRAGGQLVLGDPRAFRYRLDGTVRDTRDLLGVVAGNACKNPGRFQIVRQKEFPKLGGLSPMTGGDGLVLELSPGTQTLAAYGDGSPALTCRQVGKGRVLTFSANPFTPAVYGSSVWREFFTALQQDLGCAVSQDIWRFRFPRAETPMPPQVPDNLQCLTGNSWYWVADAPTAGPNVKLKVCCSYDRKPDLIPDSAQGSKLFNRGASMTAEPLNRAADLKGKLDPWVVAWHKGGPVTVALRFERPVTMQKVRLWMHGDIPEVTVGVRENGEFCPLATAVIPEREPVDVRHVDVELPATKSDALEIRLGERKSGKLYLAELEVWGGA